MKIAILDQENSRVIVSTVPDYLADANASSSDIASAILIALGLPVDTEHMVGEFTYIEKEYGMKTSVEELTQDFKEDALEALHNLLND